ncbi:MAG TPA: rhodanese-like domain-containing protein [bacterium]|nr:rhodanese-like domain-containing protein [bacterium]
MPDNFDYRKILLRIISITGIAIATGILFNQISPFGIPFVNDYSVIKIDKEKVKVPVFLSSKNAKSEKFEFHPPEQINIKEAHKSFFKGSAIFIDSRSKDKYKNGHIPGAISVPVNNIHPDRIDLQSIDPMQKIIVYCDDPECGLSMELAAIFEQKGFMNVHFFTGGWQAWKNAEYQVSTGMKP